MVDDVSSNDLKLGGSWLCDYSLYRSFNLDAHILHHFNVLYFTCNPLRLYYLKVL